ncbi:replication initiator, partial [Thermobifida sp.]|uniref:replication initiator n=1 Tax=Thermobifida sp. TaxID=2027107 RepID=UPI00338E69DB
MPTPTGKTTRAERLAQPLARVVAEQIAADHGVCIRPVSLRRIDTATGASEVIDVPCGSTLESRCPACARRKRSLRRTQCEEGWHLAEEPTVVPDDPSEVQRAWVERRAGVPAEPDPLAAPRAGPRGPGGVGPAGSGSGGGVRAPGGRGRVRPALSAGRGRGRGGGARP